MNMSTQLTPISWSDPTVHRPLGSTGLDVSGICIGTAGWSSQQRFRPASPSLDQTREAAARLFAGPLNFADTSNNYGGGESERRLGMVIAESGGLPAGFVLQSKLDRNMETGDFSGPRVRRSLEESLERLGLDSLPIAYLHDPENTTFTDAMSAGGPVEEMQKMHAEGLIGSLGISGGPVDMLVEYMDTGLFSAVITHNRYTLVDRSAEPVLDRAAQLGVAVLNGAPYGGGLLAAYPRITDIYHYAPARPAVLAAAERIGEYLSGRSIPMAAASLQFSLRDPRITSTIVGAQFAEHIDSALELAAIEIPDDVWTDLETMVPDRSEWIPWPLPVNA